MPATTAVSFAAGTARVGFGTAWDYDNESLTYDVFRDNGATPVYTTSIKSNFWTLPTGRFHRHRSRARFDAHLPDPDQRPVRQRHLEPGSNVVTVSSGSQSQYAQDVAADGASHFWRLGEPSGPTAYDWTGFDDATAQRWLHPRRQRRDQRRHRHRRRRSAAAPATRSTRTRIVGPNTFTEEAWIRTTSTSGGKIIGFGDQPHRHSAAATTGTSTWTPHGRVYFGVYNNGLYTTRSSAAALNDGQWHHVVGHPGPAGMTLYVDGKRVGTNGGTTAPGLHGLLADRR